MVLNPYELYLLSVGTQLPSRFEKRFSKLELHLGYIIGNFFQYIKLS